MVNRPLADIDRAVDGGSRGVVQFHNARIGTGRLIGYRVVATGRLDAQAIADFRRRRQAACDKHVDVPIYQRHRGRRCAQSHVVVAGQPVDEHERSIDPEDLGAGVDRRGKVLIAVGADEHRRRRQLVASDHRDLVVGLGAVDDGLGRAEDAEGLDVVETDPLVGTDEEAAFVGLRAGLEDHGIGNDGPDDVDQIAGRDADRIAAVDEHGDFAGGDVERVVAFQTPDLERLDPAGHPGDDPV